MTVDEKRLEELAALVAAGAATAEEERELATLEESSPEARRLSREFREAAAAMAMNLEPVRPAPGTLERIRQTIEAEAVEGGPTVEQAVPGGMVDLAAERERRQKRPRLALATAAVFAAAAAAFAGLYIKGRGELSTVREDLAVVTEELGEVTAALQQRESDVLEARTQLAATREELDLLVKRYGPVRAPTLRLATMASPQGGSANVFVEPERGRWLVLAHELPAQPGKDYQLWMVPQDGSPVSAGLLSEGPDGVLGAVHELPESLKRARPAISLEPAGGSAQPTDIKMIGDLI